MSESSSRKSSDLAAPDGGPSSSAPQVAVVSPDLSQLPTESDLPKANQPLQVYQDWMRSFHPASVWLDAKLGWVAWLRGKGLLLARQSKQVKTADFNALCKNLNISRSAAYLYMAIAAKYSPDEVKGKTMTELRDCKLKPNAEAPKGDRSKRGINLSHKNISQKLDTTLKTVQAIRNLPSAGTNVDAKAVYQNSVAMLHKIIKSCEDSAEDLQARIVRLDTRANQNLGEAA